MAAHPQIGYQGIGVMGFETQTTKGARGLTNALLIFVIVGLLTLVLNFVTTFLLDEPFTPSGGVSAGSLAATFGTAALGCGISLLALAGLIIALIGYYGMHKGRNEYGPTHEKDVRVSMMLFIVGIVVYCVGVFITVADIVASIDFTNPSEIMYAPSPVILAVSGIIGIVFAMMIALILYYLVRSFIPPEKVNMTILAITLYIISSIATLIGSLTLAPPPDYYKHPGTVPFDPVWIVPSVISGIIGILALLLFFLLYRNISAHLKSRTIKPFWETAAAASVVRTTEQRWQPPPKF